MNADQWAAVRVSRALLARLERERESMLEGEDRRTWGFERDTRDRVGLDQIIGALLDARERHRQRRKAAKPRMRAKRKRARTRARKLAAAFRRCRDRS